MWTPRLPSLSTPARIATAASVAAVAVWSAVLVVPDVQESAEPPAAEEAPAAAAPAPAAVAPAPAAVAPAAPARTLQPAAALEAARPAAPVVQALPSTLREALASDNAGTRISAVRKLAQERTTEALPELLALDVARDPEFAPTVIHVAAQLAQRAEPSQRAAAASQLSSWLKSESARPTADARGNVSLLVENLASMNAPEAESALIEVLQSDQQPLHVQTLAVDGLAKLGSPAAQAALTQFRAQLATSERQGFELELQREAEHATDRALARLSK